MLLLLLLIIIIIVRVIVTGQIRVVVSGAADAPFLRCLEPNRQVVRLIAREGPGQCSALGSAVRTRVGRSVRTRLSLTTHDWRVRPCRITECTLKEG